MPDIQEEAEDGSPASPGGTGAAGMRSMPDFIVAGTQAEATACFEEVPARDFQLEKFAEELDPGNLAGHLPSPEHTLKSLPQRLSMMSPQARQASLLLMAAHVAMLAPQQHTAAWALLAEQARRHGTAAFCTQLEDCARRWQAPSRLDIMANIQALMAALQPLSRDSACRIVVVLLGAHLSALPWSLAERFGAERAMGTARRVSDPIFAMDWNPIEAPLRPRTQQQWTGEPNAKARQAAIACFEELLSWIPRVSKVKERNFLTVHLLARASTAFAQRDLQEVIPRAMAMLGVNADDELAAGCSAHERSTTYCHGVEALKLALEHYGEDDRQTWSAFIDEQAAALPGRLYTPLKHSSLKAETRRLIDLA
ncbi:hypothetical protein GT347_04515 [Xylophilus rhododendri]|uniref:Uncharacterized protein n=1 Tax=Xylophilus rhododendri TaxID=2697032 RepID=A0A857J0R1_9BURK|nr:hypothetical protein [Xylophilus rhododendri]QHI97306.1 hypothetical protein GT347_04515 [Xylophilus rhododendri]